MSTRKNLSLDWDALRRRLPAGGKQFWRGLEELADTEEFREMVHREFPEQASEWTNPITRRRFLMLMGASFALAGLSGCGAQPPAGRIMPYVRQPEQLVPGKPLFFATAMPLGGLATGLLVESHEGRPTKVEGNPLHPASLGATDVFAQASVLGLYDPDRSQAVTYLGRPRAWSEALAAFRTALGTQRRRSGAGLRVLTETITSPTLADQLTGERDGALRREFPEARWYQYEPARSDSALEGARLAFGEFVNAIYRFEDADVVLALDADFLSRGPAHLCHVRDFANKRRVRGRPERATMNRLYVVECMPSLTGAAATAQYLEEYADFLESHLEPWTVTTEGSLVPDIRRHFIRIHPADANDPQPDEDANHGVLELRNQPPGAPTAFPGKDIVDAGFLELVRYGIRKPGDPLIEDSLRVVDTVLKVDTPFGPCWRRYNHDGYGQRPDGGPYQGWGYGHAWPLLTGERGHYELAAGRDVRPLIRAMECFATSTQLLPEQVWALPDMPKAHMRLGRPTGGAMPLVWAHAEYIQLVRSAADGQVFGLIAAVADRYRNRRAAPPLEIWKFNRQVRSLPAGETLRIQAASPFRLHWTCDEWQQAHDTDSTSIGTSHEFVDIRVPATQKAPVRFTFFWTAVEHWEGRDFQVGVDTGGREGPGSSRRKKQSHNDAGIVAAASDV